MVNVLATPIASNLLMSYTHYYSRSVPTACMSWASDPSGLCATLTSPVAVSKYTRATDSSADGDPSQVPTVGALAQPPCWTRAVPTSMIIVGTEA